MTSAFPNFNSGTMFWLVRYLCPLIGFHCILVTSTVLGTYWISNEKILVKLIFPWNPLKGHHDLNLACFSSFIPPNCGTKLLNLILCKHQFLVVWFCSSNRFSHTFSYCTRPSNTHIFHYINSLESFPPGSLSWFMTSANLNQINPILSSSNSLCMHL